MGHRQELAQQGWKSLQQLRFQRPYGIRLQQQLPVGNQDGFDKQRYQHPHRGVRPKEHQY